LTNFIGSDDIMIGSRAGGYGLPSKPSSAYQTTSTASSSRNIAPNVQSSGSRFVDSGSTQPQKGLGRSSRSDGTSTRNFGSGFTSGTSLVSAPTRGVSLSTSGHTRVATATSSPSAAPARIPTKQKQISTGDVTSSVDRPLIAPEAYLGGFGEGHVVPVEDFVEEDTVIPAHAITSLSGQYLSPISSRPKASKHIQDNVQDKYM
jgi:hypothetical protein